MQPHRVHSKALDLVDRKAAMNALPTTLLLFSSITSTIISGSFLIYRPGGGTRTRCLHFIRMAPIPLWLPPALPILSLFYQHNLLPAIKILHLIPFGTLERKHCYQKVPMFLRDNLTTLARSHTMMGGRIIRALVISTLYEYRSLLAAGTNRGPPDYTDYSVCVFWVLTIPISFLAKPLCILGRLEMVLRPTMHASGCMTHSANTPNAIASLWRL